MAAFYFQLFPTGSVAITFLRLRNKHRRITIRHVLLTLGVSAILFLLYYVYLMQDTFSRDARVRMPPSQVWAERAAQVKEAFQHAYHGYQQYSSPYDELMPVSNMTVNNFNGWGVTIVDSLDTMLLMELEDEYAHALTVVSNTNYSSSSNRYVPFFETVIRYLGGLLSAYALTGHDLLRRKADELGTRLAHAFDTKSGFPAYSVDVSSGNNSARVDGPRSFAEIASFQMEYAYLGKITGKKEHVDHATLITDLLYTTNLSEFGGMYPTRWNIHTGAPHGKFLTVGAFADSGHEYTLKQFLMTARTDERTLEMYLRFTSYVINNLLFLSPERHLLYVTDATRGRRPSHTFEHLSCFFPGLLALGVHLLPLNNLDMLGIDISSLADDLLPEDRLAYAGLSEFNLADLHLWAAEGIAETCYVMYADQPTGLGPETVRMDIDHELGAVRWIDELHAWKARNRDSRWWSDIGNLWGKGSEQKSQPPGVGDIKPWTGPSNTDVATKTWAPAGKSRLDRLLPNPSRKDYTIQNSGYYLRPETIESLYILWRTTGDVKWRHRAWNIFQAIERYTKTYSGYTSMENVFTLYPTQLDEMPSYFLAETLKYLYLIFLDEDPLPLDKWVFNTEAHPLPVFEWTLQERQAYGIM